MPNIELLINLGSFCIGALAIWLTAYAKEKGKNKALIEDLSLLENEKQQIQSKYQEKLEELKKAHSLDIKKREFKYIDKREQFTKYFALLETFNKRTNQAISEDFEPIMANFLTACISGDGEVPPEAFKSFSTSVHRLMMELNEDFFKFRAETHGVRLISSEALEGLLNELEEALKASVAAASALVNFIGTKEYWLDQSLIKPYEVENTAAASVVEDIHQKVKMQMKKELDEI